MQRTAIAAILVMGALGTLAVTRPANAVVCAAGVYRAGCVGAHGAAVVRRGGYHSGAREAGTFHAGAGLEFRLIPEKLGICAEGRYTWVGGPDDNAQARMGVRIVF